jgi:Holliday junction resolvasome RuvABC endonuclease subunit
VIDEKILALDISSKTGWASMVSTEEGPLLEACGTLPQIHQPEGAYPGSFVMWAKLVFEEIRKLIIQYRPDHLAIEETVAGSKAVYSQNIWEYNVKATYLLTGAWRSETGCKMTKEESVHNKEVKKYKEHNKTSVAYDINGKRIGRLTKKHINIRRANEIFGKFLKEPLRKKNEDLADALLLGACLHLRRMKEYDKPMG